ncbi:hypothetical protein WJX84_000179 [Apatococcus fuscideae]
MTNDLRTGRLVVPKAAAEARMPHLPEHSTRLHFQLTDGAGAFWVSSYSFWLNGTSRMYLLDGLKPALQALGCAAGDLITFSYLRTPHAERNDLDCPNDLLLVESRRNPAMAGRTGKNQAQQRNVHGSGSAPHSNGSARRGSHSGVLREQASDWPEYHQRPIPDGIFRGAPPALLSHTGKILTTGTSWVVILDLAGEAFAAYFSTAEAAMQALPMIELHAAA